MDSIKSQLVDMGFHETKIKKAIESCPEAQTLEQVMEWLIAHEDELNTGESSTKGTNNSTPNVQSTPSASLPSPVPANSKKEPQSDDFRPEETAAETAARKKITVEEAQRIIVERQAIRAEEERKKEIEDEKKRRMEGQKLIQTRAELEDQERIRLSQQIRKEKLEKELHRKKIMEQIALDRENMRNKSKPIESPVKTSSSSSSSDSATKSQPKTLLTECKIALRFPDGSTKVQKFSPQEQLAAVRLFVQLHHRPSASIEFIAPPNRKLAEPQMNETLESLNLCPASRLEVKYGPSQSLSTGSSYSSTDPSYHPIVRDLD